VVNLANYHWLSLICAAPLQALRINMNLSFLEKGVVAIYQTHKIISGRYFQKYNFIYDKN